MSDPLAEREEKGPSIGEFFSRIGTMLIILSAVVLIIIGFNVVNESAPSYQFDFVLLMLIGIGILVLSMMNIFQNRIRFQLNEVIFAIFTLVILTIAIFIAPGKLMPASNLSFTQLVQSFNAFGIIGSLIVLIAKKPNFGPEANRRIYQATGGWIAAIVAVMILVLGLIMTYMFDISEYAGSGRYPGGKLAFYEDYVLAKNVPEILVNWFSIYGFDENLKFIAWPAGWTIMIGAAIMALAAMLRNRISLKLASGVLIGGIIVTLSGLSQFNLAYWGLNAGFYSNYDQTEFEGILKLQDPGLFTFGIVLVLVELVALFFIVYASASAKPLDKWMMQRDRYIAAAEVATKEGKLDSAMKYLELAAQWSSKVDEEDKAVELLTKVRQIEKKAIQMKKSKAAEDVKKKLKDEEGKDKKVAEKKYTEVTEEAGTKKAEHVATQEGADTDKSPSEKTPEP